MKSKVDVFIKLLVMMKPVKKDGSWEIQSNYRVQDLKPNAYFDPENPGETVYVFHHEFVFKQENEFYSLPDYRQADIKANCAKTVEEDFIQNYPKKIKPICH